MGTIIAEPVKEYIQPGQTFSDKFTYSDFCSCSNGLIGISSGNSGASTKYAQTKESMAGKSFLITARFQAWYNYFGGSVSLNGTTLWTCINNSGDSSAGWSSGGGGYGQFFCDWNGTGWDIYYSYGSGKYSYHTGGDPNVHVVATHSNYATTTVSWSSPDTGLVYFYGGGTYRGSSQYRAPLFMKKKYSFAKNIAAP